MAKKDQIALNPLLSDIGEINKAYTRGDATEHTHWLGLKTLIESLDNKITGLIQRFLRTFLTNHLLSIKLTSAEQICSSNVFKKVSAP